MQWAAASLAWTGRDGGGSGLDEGDEISLRGVLPHVQARKIVGKGLPNEKQPSRSSFRDPSLGGRCRVRFEIKLWTSLGEP